MIQYLSKHENKALVLHYFDKPELLYIEAFDRFLCVSFSASNWPITLVRRTLCMAHSSRLFRASSMETLDLFSFATLSKYCLSKTSI